MTSVRPDNARKLAWAHKHDRGQCPCGATTGIGSRRRGYKHCASCAREIAAVAVAMRRERIYEMWHQGATRSEIARQLGMTANYVGVDVARMRATGWDMPYRHGGYPR